jgi:hypothetical protein
MNAARYFDERCQGERPDFIIVKLGINDCFGFNPDDAKQLTTGTKKGLATVSWQALSEK